MMQWRSRKFGVLLAFSGFLVQLTSGQDLPADFGTAQGTERLAASAGFIDVLDIKLGMPAESALARLKANNPTSKITFSRARDYETTWRNNSLPEDPKRKWVLQIDVEPSGGVGDRIAVGLSLPPGKQVVDGVSRSTFFKDPVAVQNIVAGLRKKYGQETVGPGFRFGTMTLFDGADKIFIWIFDLQGNQMNSDVVAKRTDGCAVGLSMGTVDNTIRTSDWRAYGRDRLKNNPCEAYVILTARILALNAPPGINGMATSLEVVAFDWPLFNSSVTALYGFLDQRARELKNKEIQDANKRGGDVKY